MMSRRVRRKVVRRGKEKVDCPETDENLSLDENGMLDWTRLPDDTVIQLFSCLNYRDRASLSSTCRTWWILGKSPCLWQVLDLRPHKCDATAAAALASRCDNLQKLRFRGPESAEAVIKLQAKNLREISGDCCRKMTDATLSVLAARHEALESLVIGPDFCERISSDAVKAIAICCPKLQKLRISGLHEVDADAINALAKNCRNLTDIGFIDCRKVDETALDINPTTVSRLFSSSVSLKVLCALSCPSLEEDASFGSNRNHRGKVLLAVFTDILKGVATLFVDTPKNNMNVFLDWRYSKVEDRRVNEILNWLEWIISNTLHAKVAESNPPGLDNFWLNQGTTLLLSFMQSPQEDVQERSATALANFVVIDDENASIDIGRAEAVMREGGIRLLLNLARSWREGLQSEAAKAIANLSVNANVAKAVADEGGISILVNLARSVNRLVAEEAAGALWNLSVGEDHKGAIAEASGVKALVDLIFKWSRSSGGEGVLERAAGALANLAADDKCSTEVASVGGVHALVTLARTCKVEGVQEQIRYCDSSYSMPKPYLVEICDCGPPARALANLAAHGDSNSNNAVVGQEAGALEALVQLTRSQHDGVRQEAAGALWNLSFDDRNREAIAASGGVEALVALAHSCLNTSHGLQERAAGALWGLSVSEANSICLLPLLLMKIQPWFLLPIMFLETLISYWCCYWARRGVAPLIALARSDAEDVHETAAGALWNLAFNPGNALCIVEEGGVPALVHLCSSSVSKMARFMSALALAYMFDGRERKHHMPSLSISFSLFCDELFSGSMQEGAGVVLRLLNLVNSVCRMDEIALVGTSTESTSKSVNLDGLRRTALKHIEAFHDLLGSPSICCCCSVISPCCTCTTALRSDDCCHAAKSFSDTEGMCCIRTASVPSRTLSCSLPSLVAGMQFFTYDFSKVLELHGFYVQQQQQQVPRLKPKSLPALCFETWSSIRRDCVCKEL
ncbi:protein ARABIDILLO 1 [Sesamum angolense]|uniref:Protein ARABIDILLO 1 n=2 Tax=Magnoliopsida TaxID=3398 RepID=A0AAE1XGV9_9LAMI|nr:protein ARABIDILLO 1 [Sesamum angolense]